jgi:uncharacterized protein
MKNKLLALLGILAAAWLVAAYLPTPSPAADTGKTKADADRAKAEADREQARIDSIKAIADAKGTDVKPEELQKITDAMPTQAFAKPAKPRKLLVFTLWQNYYHDAIPVATAAFRIMGEKTGAFEITATNDVAIFTPENLAKFDGILMNSSCGDHPTSEAGKAALVAYVKAGHGLIGIHSATDSNHRWAEYGEMFGGFFQEHPIGHVSVKIDDPTSPLTAMFDGKGFEFRDEIYAFQTPYSRDVDRVLMSIDYENSAFPTGKGKRNDHDYALSWIHEYGQGRVFYCSFGHNHEVYWNPAILKHYLAGIQYALGDLAADATPSAKLSPAPQAARGPVIKQ